MDALCSGKKSQEDIGYMHNCKKKLLHQQLFKKKLFKRTPPGSLIEVDTAEMLNG